VAEQKKQRRGRTRRVLVVGGLVLVVVIAGLLALAPTIASGFVPGAVASAGSGAINGSVTCDDASLSWFGSQRVGPVVVTDEAGTQVARVELEVRRGLAGLALGSRDLGVIRVTGSASVVRNPDGTTNLESLLRKGPDAAGEPPQAPPAGTGGELRLPGGLAGELVLDGLTVEYTDAKPTDAGGDVDSLRLVVDSGSATLREGTLTAALNAGASAADGRGSLGGVEANATVTQLIGSDGLVRPEAARLDGTLEISDLATSLVGLIAAVEPSLLSGIGDRLNASLDISGGLSSGTVSLTASSPGATADTRVAWDESGIRGAGPGTFSLVGERWRSLLEELSSMSGGAQVALTTAPDVTVEIRSFEAPREFSKVPTGSFDVRAQVGAAAGSVEIQDEPPVDWTLSPVELSATADSAAGVMRLVATTAGGEAGEAAPGGAGIDADVKVSGFAEGSESAKIDGTVTLARVPTALAQPFARRFNLDLPTDLGPVLDASIEADMTTSDSGADAPPLASLTGDANFSIDSRYLNGRGTVVAKDGRLEQAGPIEVSLRQGRRLATRLAKPAGLTVSGAAPFELSVTDLSADLARLAPGEGGAVDLRAISGRLTFGVQDLRGDLAHDAPELTGDWVLNGVNLVLDATQPEDALHLDATWTGRWSGESLGRTEARIVGRGLFDDQGGLRREPGVVELAASISALAPVAAQAFVDELGLRLADAIGPTVDLSVDGELRPTLGDRLGFRSSEVTLQVHSNGLTGRVALAADDTGARATGEGIDLTLRQTGRLLARFVPADGPVRPLPGGALHVTSTDVSLPFEQGSFSPRLAAAAGTVSVATTGLGAEVHIPDSGGGRRTERLELSDARATATLDGDAHVTFDSTLSMRGDSFALTADMKVARALERLLSDEPSGWLPVEPVGRLEARDLPLSLAELISIETGQGPRPLARLLGGILADRTRLTLITSAAEDGLALEAAGSSGQTSLETSGLLREGSLGVQSLTGNLRAEAAAVNRLLGVFTEDASKLPSASGPTEVSLSVDSFSVPLAAEGGPRLGRIGTVRATARAKTSFGLANVLPEPGAGTPARLPTTLSTDDVEIVTSLPLGALAGGGEPSAASISMTGSFADEAGEPLGSATASASGALGPDGPSGPVSAQVSLSEFRTPLADALLGERGLVSNAIGQRARLEASTTLSLSGDDGAATTLSNLDLTIDADAPRLKLAGPIKLRMRPDRFELASAAEASMTPTNAWAARYLLGAEASGPSMGFASPPTIALNLSKLTVARGDGIGPLKPGVFRAQGEMTSELFELNLTDGSIERLEGVRLTLDSDPQNSQLLYSARVARLGGSAAPGGGAALSAQGAIGNLTDGSGRLLPENARFNMDLSAPSLPTNLLDDLAQQGGMLTSALGPTISLEARTRRLSRSEGTITVDANASNGSLKLRGEIADEGVLALSPETTASLTRITPDFGATLIKALPLVGDLQKLEEDAPATVTTSGLRVPIDGDIARLDGGLTLDPGVARFQASPVFGRLLKVVNRQEQSFVGRRLEPLTLAMSGGVISYERYKLPLGEFTVETEGREIDLVNRRLDIVTWIPLGALTDEAAGRFNTGLGSAIGRAVPVLDKLTLLPWRTRGPLDGPSTTPAVKLFVERFGQTLLRPDKLLGKEGLLGDLLGRDKDKDEDKDDGGG